ncbi:SDR family oxidoreductase [Thalassospira sp.]|uniref:SDR family oxidoreductase n=1 Tax=Thalassospira sp. TaxID=1912094 RepID=UPI000C62D54C|nr:SDR family oxidoreductase [Thalassospira sp.]MBC08255.1 short-chain dehydrogenase/reductase [Thalassospira sp.]|tara:strand:+ start:3757 stop:4602 length:846 start_codon:yes stop_codon:yes gene_type:complete
MDKTWLITGASSGFGRGLTEKLLARGDRVIATVRRKGSLDELVAQYGDRLRVAYLDVSDADAVQATVDQAFADVGRIDFIVSNAAYGILGAAEETGIDQMRQIIDTNLLGSIVLIKAALPHLRAQGSGRIIQVSSEGGQIAYPGFSLYHATKWGIEGFVESLAKEVAPFDIDFMIVQPGPTRTAFIGSIVFPDPIGAYDGTPAHDVKDALGGGWVVKGDPDRMVKAMIHAADAAKMPFRLLLGTDAYAGVHAALSDRLAVLEAGKDVTLAADFTEEELAAM